ncbi:glutamine--fructose-6-phosphate transaminase (isomerizing) [Candidatus Poribacteria bacterium]|nr:glutamine--fructose-6-phosphate transaminase (isomerizing) [Candidatus Poribacteria bacterium]
MCGIVGYIGDKYADSVLWTGLERLQYRGYDSAGMAVISDGELDLRKRAGKLRELDECLRQNPMRGAMGIGHTRWATHGEPNERNAHPHTDEDKTLAVVHNGIIENYLPLKRELQARGHLFKSDTDTEVLAHLVEEALEGDFGDAVCNALQQVEGTYSAAFIHRRFPDCIVAARRGSPLILGLGDGENFVASDVPALLPHTQRMVYLEDNQIAILTPNQVEVQTMEGEQVEPRIHQIGWSPDTADKGDHPHFMLKEIHEQPNVLRRLYNIYVTDDMEVDFGELGLDSEFLARVNRIVIQACGTSWHAGLIGKYLLEQYAYIHTEVDISSEFRYRNPVLEGDTLVIAISQSGETADTLEGLRKAKSKFMRVLALCNEINSTIAREADAVIELHAGLEIGVASTKAYTAQIAVLGLLAMHLGKLKEILTPPDTREFLQTLKKAPALMDRTIQRQQIRVCAEKYSDVGAFMFIGRSYNYPNALEGALKLKEISYIHAAGHPAGELKHGPIALINEEVPVVCIATNSSIYPKIVSAIQEIRARDGVVIAIATEGNTEIHEYAQEVLYIPDIAEEVSPLLVAIPLQLLAYYTAVHRGCDVDQPRNLAKSVTVE